MDGVTGRSARAAYTVDGNLQATSRISGDSLWML